MIGKVSFKKTKGKSKITAAGDANHKKVVKNVKLIIVVK